jgi:membrane protease YdiL (CAAX protease family)
MRFSDVVVFYVLAVAGAAIGSFAARRIGWTIDTAGWALAASVIMWTPALARLVATRVAGGWVSPFPLSRLGTNLALVFIVPAAVELSIYIAAYASGMIAGHAHWAPTWSGARLVTNLAVNLPLLIVIGLLVSTGEELGWRGYLQPRLDELGVRYSFLLVGVLWAAFHVPIMILAGYERSETSAQGLTLFTICCICDSYLWWRVCASTGSLMPAVWFHTFHNIASQWLLPHLVQTDSTSLLSEHGILPTVFHVLAAIAAALLFPLRV